MAATSLIGWLFGVKSIAQQIHEKLQQSWFFLNLNFTFDLEVQVVRIERGGDEQQHVQTYEKNYEVTSFQECFGRSGIVGNDHCSRLVLHVARFEKSFKVEYVLQKCR